MSSRARRPDKGAREAWERMEAAYVHIGYGAPIVAGRARRRDWESIIGRTYGATTRSGVPVKAWAWSVKDLWWPGRGHRGFWCGVQFATGGGIAVAATDLDLALMVAAHEYAHVRQGELEMLNNGDYDEYEADAQDLGLFFHEKATGRTDGQALCNEAWVSPRIVKASHPPGRTCVSGCIVALSCGTA